MHDNFIESFSEYLDGELEADRKDGLEKHLKECAECSATLADLRRVVMQARSLPMRAPSEKVWSAIASEVALATDESSPSARVSRRAPSRILAAAALLIALLLGAGGSAWWIAHQAQSNRSGTRWLLLLHETASVPDGQVKGASMEQIIARYAAWNREHAQVGEKLTDTGGIRLDRDGQRNELASADPIGGMFIIEAADETRAIALARTCPHLDYGGWIELRRIEDVGRDPGNMSALGYSNAR